MTTFIEGGVTAAKGFQAAGVHCGIRKNRAKKDLGLIVSDRPAAAAAVYTRNLVKGAPADRDGGAYRRRQGPRHRLQQRHCQHLRLRRRGKGGGHGGPGGKGAGNLRGRRAGGLYRRHRPFPFPGAHRGGAAGAGGRPVDGGGLFGGGGHHDHRYGEKRGGRDLPAGRCDLHPGGMAKGSGMESPPIWPPCCASSPPTRRWRRSC